MKKIILLLFIFTVQVNFSQKVTGTKVTYKLFDGSEAERAKKFTDFKRKMLQEVADIREKLNFELIYTDDKSAFYLQDIYIPNVDEYTIPLASNILNLGEFYYKDTKKAYYYRDYDNVKKYFKIDQSNIDYEWEIKNETKQILGYTCKKAVGYDPLDLNYGAWAEITAWFTTEIPNSYGPKNYGNLPGLILEATVVTRKTVTYKAVKVEKNIKIKFPKDKKPMKEFTPETYWEFHEKVTDMKYGRN